MMQAEDVELARLRRTPRAWATPDTKPARCRALALSLGLCLAVAELPLRVYACARVRVCVPLTAAGGAGCNPPARWDGRRLELFDGTYGDYLISKVAKVSPSQLPRSS